VGATYWKVSNGIRLTGMPGFNDILTATQMWQISEMLAHADKLPDQTKAVLVKPMMVPGPAPAAGAQPNPTPTPADESKSKHKHRK